MTISVDRSKDNKSLVMLADELTAWLDQAREDILAGLIPNYAQIIGAPSRFKQLSNPDPSPPITGTPLRAELVSHVKELLSEVDEYVSAAAARKPQDIEKIQRRQEKHRREDIKRLRVTFAEAGNEKMLAKTLNIDYTQPLEPQLGFNPDDY
jgi:hypothetical protein